MLNKAGERELAYVVLIDGIEPIPGYDRVETAIVGGWHIIVQKDQFKIGDPAIYFEIDSRVPKDKECFAFLEKRNYKIKTLKMCGTISQGLLMHASDFGWDIIFDGTKTPYIYDGKKAHYADDESRFLTKILGVTYADDEDNKRKAPSVDKYKKMSQRHPNIFKKPWARWLMKRSWGRKLMFMFFGKKKDKKGGWPSWVAKTDEERIQNMPWLFPSCPTAWIATEKIDGTSTTFTMKNDRKKEMLVCSRNVVYNRPEKEELNYYKDSDGNVYLEMAEKYHMSDVLKQMIAELEVEHRYDGSREKVEYITVQGETYGGNIQKRNYGAEHRLAVFNIIYKYAGAAPVRMNPIDGKAFAEKFGLTYVPVVQTNVILPETCDAVVAMAHGTSAVDGSLREGLVFRSYDGAQSFKAVDPEFLLKYHG